MPSSNISLTFSLTDADRTAKGGSKAINLARLHAAGYAVPRGFVLGADAYRAHLWSTGARTQAAQAAHDGEARESLRRAILSTSVGNEVRDAVAKAYERLSWQLGEDEPAVVVRSSALEGSQGEMTFPGAYDSFVGVRGFDKVVEAVRRVWASAWGARAAVYRASADCTHEPAMAVIVQQMIEGTRTGTVRTANPVTGDPCKVLVSFYDQAATDSSEINCIEIDLRSKSADGEFHLVVEKCILIEESFGGPVEVEWTLEDGSLWLLQARPLDNLPEFFPLPQEKLVNGRWERICRRPVSSFAHSLLWRSPQQPLEAFPNGCGKVETREISGYVYSLREVAPDPEDDSERRKRVGAEAAVGARLLARWEKSVSSELAADARRITRRDLASLPNWRLSNLLESTADSAVEAARWMELAWYPGTRTVDLLRRMLGDEAWRKMRFGLLSGLPASATRRDEQIQEFGRRFAAAEDSGKLSSEGWWRGYRAEVEQFAATYGYSFLSREEMCDPSTWKSWPEDLDLVFRMIATTVHAGDRPELQQIRSGSVESAHEAASTAAALFKGKQRSEFQELLRQARGWLAAQVETEQVFALCCAAVRAILLELADRMVGSGLISQKDDIFHLTLDDILSAPTKPSDTERGEMLSVVARRKHEQWLQARLQAPEWLNPTESDLAERILSVTPVVCTASPGTAAGKVLSARTIEEAAAIEPGQILFVEEPTLAWTPFLAVAGGIVAERGWPAGAALAREHGVPMVSGREGLASNVRTGQRLLINGDDGTVEVNP